MLLLPIADAAANALFATAAATANTTYYAADAVHLTDAGQLILAGIYLNVIMSA